MSAGSWGEGGETPVTKKEPKNHEPFTKVPATSHFFVKSFAQAVQQKKKKVSTKDSFCFMASLNALTKRSGVNEKAEEMIAA